MTYQLANEIRDLEGRCAFPVKRIERGEVIIGG